MTLFASRLFSRSVLAAALVACAAWSTQTLVHAQEAAPTLNLSQRRALKEYQETKFPELQKQIQAAAKFDVPLEVQWDNIADHGVAESYKEDAFFTDIYFLPLIDALKKITADSMGADSLKAKLKKIVFTCDKDAVSGSYDEGVKFKDGTLTIDFSPFTNAGDRKERAQGIGTVLDKVL